MTYQQLHSLPPFVLAEQNEHGQTTNHGGEAVWSGFGHPPALGETVYITVNDRGHGVVRAYFVQSGWLGVVVDLSAPPAPYLDQHGADTPCHVFGAELGPPPMLARAEAFDGGQLDALRQHYAAIASIDPELPYYADLVGALDAMPDTLLRQIADADIKFLSALALNRCIRRGV